MQGLEGEAAPALQWAAEQLEEDVCRAHRAQQAASFLTAAVSDVVTALQVHPRLSSVAINMQALLSLCCRARVAEGAKPAGASKRRILVDACAGVSRGCELACSKWASRQPRPAIIFVRYRSCGMPCRSGESWTHIWH